MRLATLALCPLVVALVCVTGMALADDFSPSAIQTVKHSVAPIECVRPPQQVPDTSEGASGTAFFVSKTGAFVTADHVIQRMQSLGARCKPALLLPDGGWKNENAGAGERAIYPFDPATCDEDRADDVAVCLPAINPFATPSVKDEIAPVAFQISGLPDGTQVAFTGFPQGYAWPVTGTGSIASTTPVNEVPALTIDALSWHGMSGCPIYTHTGEVVGMLVGAEGGDDEGLSIARPARVITALLRQAQISAGR